jgi:hypothetical protein
MPTALARGLRARLDPVPDRLPALHQGHRAMDPVLARPEPEIPPLQTSRSQPPSPRPTRPRRRPSRPHLLGITAEKSGPIHAGRSSASSDTERVAAISHQGGDRSPQMGVKNLSIRSPAALRRRRVRPLGIDRYGVRLRVENEDGDHDARLPFAQPVRRRGRVEPRHPGSDGLPVPQRPACARRL